MLLLSLIFLLLSNSITSRRDKSILYSRIAVTILIISIYITYDNLFLLFSENNIGILLCLSVSVITLVIASFIFIPEELLSLANILALLIFNL